MTYPYSYPEDLTRMLDGIRDPARLEIILMLGKSRAMNVTDIASHFRISRPAISHHLKVLKDAGIVQCERMGQEIYYRVNTDKVVQSLRQMADLIENCCSSEPKP